MNDKSTPAGAEAPSIHHKRNAPGAPGAPATWTASCKSGIGTSLRADSRVWFTLLRGIVSEVYWPRVDRAAIRDLQLLVSDGNDFFADEFHDTRWSVEYLEPGVPAYRVVNRCRQDHFRIEKQIIAHPARDVLLMKVRFIPLRGSLQDYHLYALLAPHLCDSGEGNTAWLGTYKGHPLLCGQKSDACCALACSAGWMHRSAGFVGSSDGWHDVSHNKRLTVSYERAENGNVALIGEIDLVACDGEFVLALAFGTNESEAGHQAIAAFLDGFDCCREAYIEAWKHWHAGLMDMGNGKAGTVDYRRVSAMVLRLHAAHQFKGGAIASLSIPWGEVSRKSSRVGYHVAWGRDLCQAAGAALAIGNRQFAFDVLKYLAVTQEPQGCWPQNMWLDGAACWASLQMDEVAFPILLAEQVAKEKALSERDREWAWKMVRSAAWFMVRRGPTTKEDRWEQNEGYSANTIATEIAALVVAADWARQAEDRVAAQYFLDLADAWNEQIEQWLFVQNTQLSKKLGIDGYYIRLAPIGDGAIADPYAQTCIANRYPPHDRVSAAEVTSPDALALVRFGLRRPDDPRIQSTLRAIDATLKTETPHGPVWHRYRYDGYGEHEDGSPFDGHGIGRGWPILVGERAHIELAAGRGEKAHRLLQTMEGCTNEVGFLPEQVWDERDILERELFLGKPTGSAMPLVWSHAEYLKLLRSLHDGRVFDLPEQVAKRYAEGNTPARHAIWNFHDQRPTVPRGRRLRLQVSAPALVRFTTDSWRTAHEMLTENTGAEVFYVDLPAQSLAINTEVVFTFRWLQDNRWEGRDFRVRVIS